MFNTQEECIAMLEQLRWGGQPSCPYCNSKKAASFKKERRYHCNTCFTSYSVTVGTLFHKTHVDLSKWFQAICLILNDDKHTSTRQLAQGINVNKNTASYMIARIRLAQESDDLLLADLYQCLLEISKKNKF